MQVCLSIMFVWLFSAPLISQTLSNDLSQDIADGQLDQFSRIEAALIISGADSNSQLEGGLKWYYELVQDIKDKNLIGFDRIAAAENLFLYLHASWLKDYDKKATTLFNIMRQKEYNCVSATVLYNLFCDELGLATEAFETPTHVYTIFSNFTHQVMVENTTSMGFNIIKNLNRYSEYLLQYYPQNEALKIGLDRLYAYENSTGRRINNTELLGLISYNRAIFHVEDKNYEKAYDYVLLAQLFNADSRSNRKFEISLYYHWGQDLFVTKQFYNAFEVLADAYYRYPDNSDFKNNCRAAFMTALKQLWLDKIWDKTRLVIIEMADLDILSEKEAVVQKQILTDWIHFLTAQKRNPEAEQAIELFKSHYGEGNNPE